MSSYKNGSHRPEAWELLLTLGVILAVIVSGHLLIPQKGKLNDLEWQIGDLQQKINDPQLEITLDNRLSLKKDLLVLKKDEIVVENTVASTLIQTIGGLFFIVTAYLTWRNVKAGEDKQVTERFSTAVDQLGNKKLEVRLGGIYALERIAKDSAKDHWTIMEVLTAFIREKSRVHKSKNSHSQEHITLAESFTSEQHNFSNQQQQLPKIPIPKISTDVQAALTVIGRLNSSQPLEDKYLNLTNAYLVGAHMEGAHMEGAHLEGTNLRSSHLDGIHLEGAHMEGADLESAHLMKAHLKGAHLEEAHLSGADLIGAHLEKAHLSRANLIGAHMSGGVHLEISDLSGVNLEEADLSETIFRNTDLMGANFSGSNLMGADLNGANLWDNFFGGANFCDAQNLTTKQVKSAKNWEKAIYDDDFCKQLDLPPASKNKNQNN